MTESRQQLLSLLAELSEADPELRLGQMLTNLTTQARGPDAGSVWECEDVELIAEAERLLARLQQRKPEVV